MSTTTNLDTLKINYLTQEQYNTALENGEIGENEIYLTPGGGGGVALTQAEYDALTTDEKNNDIIYFITDGSASTRNPYLDMNYPIGSYYETSDANFDPNTVWGGTWVKETEQIYTAAWTATSSNANNQRVTASLTLPAGTYIFSIKCPVVSQNSVAFSIAPMGLATGGWFGSGQVVNTTLYTLTGETTVYAATDMSSATTYTYIERGYLKAYRITPNYSGKWHRTA